MPKLTATPKSREDAATVYARGPGLEPLPQKGSCNYLLPQTMKQEHLTKGTPPWGVNNIFGANL